MALECDGWNKGSHLSGISVEQKQVMQRLFSEGILITQEIFADVQAGVPYQDLLDKYEQTNASFSVDTITKQYRYRLAYLRSLLQSHYSLKDACSLRRIRDMQRGDSVVSIGLVIEKTHTRNGHIRFRLEDESGRAAFLALRDRYSFKNAEKLLEDGVVAVKGSLADSVIFVDDIIFPDIHTSTFLQLPHPGKLICIGDMHIGSKLFYAEAFIRCIEWIQEEKPDYLIITGDLVDGVGTYPGQENDLVIPSILEQYRACAAYLSKVPSSTQIYICPGNHDAVRIAEPQPALHGEVTKMFSGKNITFLPSPIVMKLAKTQDFPGLTTIIYHGNSYPYYATRNSYLQGCGGMDAADKVMELLLQHRHLSPTWGAVQYIPESTHDPLLIEEEPDLFISGHMHTRHITHYKKTTCLDCSSWIEATEYQRQRGIKPQPCQAILVDLQSRKTKIKDFGEETHE